MFSSMLVHNIREVDVHLLAHGRPGGSRVRPQVRLQAAKQGSRCIVSVHPFPSKHRGAGRASTQLLTMVCVGSVSLEFVLTKSDSDSENNAQHEKC